MIVLFPELFFDFDKTMLLENTTNKVRTYIIKMKFIIIYFTILFYHIVPIIGFFTFTIVDFDKN